jgi:uroporphyrinogen-III synthase
VSGGALRGRRIVVPESRELDLFCAMLERRGAETLRCPMVAIRDVPDPAPVEAWLHRLAASAFPDLVLLTGEGVTRLLGHARRIGIEHEAKEGFTRARVVVRGPKPARALREAGLSPGLSAQGPTTEGVIATLRGLDLSGRTVGVQLYPGNPNEPLTGYLAEAGARADPVLPYAYASDEEDERVGAVLRLMAAGAVDLIAFTSTPQVRRLKDVAHRFGMDAEWREALRRTRVAAVGPVTAEAVEAAGGRAGIVPPANFHLKPFVTEIVAALGPVLDR